MNNYERCLHLIRNETGPGSLVAKKEGHAQMADVIPLGINVACQGAHL